MMFIKGKYQTMKLHNY